jgi:hypothetical protein
MKQWAFPGYGLLSIVVHVGDCHTSFSELKNRLCSYVRMSLVLEIFWFKFILCRVLFAECFGFDFIKYR